MSTTRLFEKELKIEDGPSRDRIIDAFKYCYDKDVTVSLVFKAKDCRSGRLHRYNFQGHILSLKHEDNTGNTLSWTGWFRSVQDDRKIFHYEAKYDAQKREGWIGILPNWN